MIEQQKNTPPSKFANTAIRPLGLFRWTSGILKIYFVFLLLMIIVLIKNFKIMFISVPTAIQQQGLDRELEIAAGVGNFMKFGLPIALGADMFNYFSTKKRI